MKRFLSLLLLFSFLITGCETKESTQKKLTEQDIRNAVTELVQGLNDGDLEVVKKYVGAATPVAEKLINNLNP
ncbi:hypothetical protein Dred_0624 [Desulforamulus reducens MI-1]|uniref:Uncharacterized protein n=1 Tax=Desulforamulus reducens (strain ATCC BAA-1160 / DSM 100696 / MI-1) TaxID=349161 RepID=A4J261_DESRM|nr:hypothetical protein [Desulforamulus reducens]ABO49164.1 hypothetical protein Dred_0624 [Desulforamulus reducens MI-1]